MKKEFFETPSIPEKKYFYAVMLEGKQTPSKLYENRLDADNEAIRLASRERVTAYVLMAISKTIIKDVELINIV